jgi:hypothetical protein
MNTTVGGVKWFHKPTSEEGDNAISGSIAAPFRSGEETFWKTDICDKLSHMPSAIIFNWQWGSRIRCPAGVVNFSLHHRVQNGFGAHPAS